MANLANPTRMAIDAARVKSAESASQVGNSWQRRMDIGDFAFSDFYNGYMEVVMSQGLQDCTEQDAMKAKAKLEPDHTRYLRGVKMESYFDKNDTRYEKLTYPDGSVRWMVLAED